jgi:hypothetical protein
MLKSSIHRSPLNHRQLQQGAIGSPQPISTGVSSASVVSMMQWMFCITPKDARCEGALTTRGHHRRPVKSADRNAIS